MPCVRWTSLKCDRGRAGLTDPHGRGTVGPLGTPRRAASGRCAFPTLLPGASEWTPWMPALSPHRGCEAGPGRLHLLQRARGQGGSHRQRGLEHHPGLLRGHPHCEWAGGGSGSLGSFQVPLSLGGLGGGCHEDGEDETLDHRRFWSTRLRAIPGPGFLRWACCQGLASFGTSSQHLGGRRDYLLR